MNTNPDMCSLLPWSWSAFYVTWGLPVIQAQRKHARSLALSQYKCCIHLFSGAGHLSGLQPPKKIPNSWCCLRAPQARCHCNELWMMHLCIKCFCIDVTIANREAQSSYQKINTGINAAFYTIHVIIEEFTHISESLQQDGIIPTCNRHQNRQTCSMKSCGLTATREAFVDTIYMFYSFSIIAETPDVDVD